MLSPERALSNSLLRAWCAGVTGDVLSVGSGGDIDKEGGTYRSYFRQATSYTTSDIVPGCDRYLDVRRMDLPRDSMDAVFCSGVLEHVDDVFAAVSEMHRVLRRDGLVIAGVPFLQPIHRAPADYWRFTEHGVRMLFSAFEVTDVVALGKTATPYGYWARAVKRG